MRNLVIAIVVILILALVSCHTVTKKRDFIDWNELVKQGKAVRISTGGYYLLKD